MILEGIGNFRGLEQRQSKNGTFYSLLKFEDETFSQLSFYVGSNVKMDILPNALERGKDYCLTFNYHYNSFQNRYEAMLTNVTDIKVAPNK